MVQEFYVLKCNSCYLFQVHIIRKTKRWICKVCGMKQSIIKVYGQGSSKDCRIQVQKLNELGRSQNMVTNGMFEMNEKSLINNEGSEISGELTAAEIFPRTQFINGNVAKHSKWRAYLEDDVNNIQTSSGSSTSNKDGKELQESDFATHEKAERIVSSMLNNEDRSKSLNSMSNEHAEVKNNPLVKRYYSDQNGYLSSPSSNGSASFKKIKFDQKFCSFLFVNNEKDLETLLDF